MTVERFDCTNGGMHYCAGCYTMEEDCDGEYVRYKDYAKLEQQRAALVEALKSAMAAERADAERYRWIRTNAQADGVTDLDEQIDAARKGATKEPTPE